MKETNVPKNKGKVTMIARSYFVTSKELRRLFKLKGRINFIGQYSGLSPQQRAEGKDPDSEVWEINTEENFEEKNANN